MKIHHLAFRTSDLLRLRAFYVEGLGFQVVRERSGQSVWLDAGGAILMLERAAPPEPVVPAGSMDLVAFAIAEDGEGEILARLEALGVALEARTEHTLYFRDPDGRRVGVSHFPIPR